MLIKYIFFHIHRDLNSNKNSFLFQLKKCILFSLSPFKNVLISAISFGVLFMFIRWTNFWNVEIRTKSKMKNEKYRSFCHFHLCFFLFCCCFNQFQCTCCLLMTAKSSQRLKCRVKTYHGKLIHGILLKLAFHIFVDWVNAKGKKITTKKGVKKGWG